MFKCLSILVCWLLFLGANTEQKNLIWLISNPSFVQINGKTNINTFTCKLAKHQFKDTLKLTKSAPYGNCRFFDNKIKLEVEGFSCENSIMTSEMHQTLKHKSFPYIFLQFKSLVINSKTHKGQSEMRLRIAGVEKAVQVPCTEKINGNGFQLIGKKMIALSDYNLTAPTKFFGAVSVHDSIEINFNLNLRPL